MTTTLDALGVRSEPERGETGSDEATMLIGSDLRRSSLARREQLVAELSREFPVAPEWLIAHVANQAIAVFDDASITAFVPILARRVAADRLRVRFRDGAFARRRHREEREGASDRIPDGFVAS